MLKVINDHNGNEETITGLAVATYVNAEDNVMKQNVLLAAYREDEPNLSLNNIYINEDGMIHISVWSSPMGLIENGMISSYDVDQGRCVISLSKTTTTNVEATEALIEKYGRIAN